MPTTAASFTAAWRKSTSSTSRGDRRPGAPSGPRGRALRPRAAARRSRDQEHLARRLPPFQGPVGLGGVLEGRSEEHTSELQSHSDLVCRLLLEKKKDREGWRR